MKNGDGMEKKFAWAAIVAALTLAGCGGGGGGGSTGGIANIGGSGSAPDGTVYPIANTSGVHLLSTIGEQELVIPKIGSVYNFDGSQVTTNSKGQLTYYLADRNAPGANHRRRCLKRETFDRRYCPFSRADLPQ